MKSFLFFPFPDKLSHVIQTVYFMMIPDGQLQNFQITVYLAIVGQSVGILNMIYQQTKMDIFFLDWEKPRKVMAKDGEISFKP
jgi:meckelin